MGTPILGLVVDSSVLIAAERRNLTSAQAIQTIQTTAGELPLMLSPMTIAEIGHGIYRANSSAVRDRRRAFLNELKATIPVHSITEVTGEIIARISGEQAAKGINLPLADIIIAACALELGYAVGTGNAGDFSRIPDLQIFAI